MTTFWLLAVAMSIVALLFTVPPLLRNRQTASVDRDQLNTEVIKEQLAELKADLDAGKLDQSAYAAACRDLERELLDELETNAAAQTREAGSGRWAVALFVPLIPLLSMFIYQQLGALHLLEQIESGQPETASSGEAAPHEMQAMVEKLAERMRAEPDNLEGWVLLARSYASMRRFQEAADAYAQARRLGGDKPELLIDYADMLIAASRGRFNDEIGQLLKSALQQQPDNVKGLWLIGHWHNQRGEYRAAIEHWQRAAVQLPPGGPDAAAINQQIQQAKANLGGSATLASADQPSPGRSGAPAVESAGIQVNVALDEAMRDRTSPDDTVFIFARAVNGPRMPLAIVRKRVRDLPVTVTLDDSLAMTPAMVLSNFSEVTVGARVSKTGQAMPGKGDLQGILEPVPTDGKDTLDLTINQVIP